MKDIAIVLIMSYIGSFIILEIYNNLKKIKE